MKRVRLLSVAVVSIAIAAAAWAAIDSATPTQGAIGQTIDVAGSGFGLKPTAYLENAATLKHYALKVTLPSDTSLKATVTKGVAGLHSLVVTPKGKGATPLRFSSIELVGPTITNVIPSKAELGADLVVACPACGSKKGKVLIAGKPAKIVRWNGTEGRIDVKVPKTIPLGAAQVVVQNSLGQSVPADMTVLAVGSSKGAFDATFGGVHWATVPTATTDDLWFTTNGGGGSSPTGFQLFATHVGKESNVQFAYTLFLNFSIPANPSFPVTSTAPVSGPQSLGVGSISYERDRTTKPFAFVGGANLPVSGFLVTIDSFDGQTLVGSFNGTASDTNGTFADIAVIGTFTAHLKTP